MKKTAFILLGALGVLLFLNGSALAATPKACGARWKKVFEADVRQFSMAGRATAGTVADLERFYDQGCEFRIQYRYQLGEGTAGERRANKLFSCAVSAINDYPSAPLRFECVSPLWFGSAEEGAPKMWSEVVTISWSGGVGNTEVSVTGWLYEAHKDVQGTAELFPPTASGSVRVFVKK